MPDEDEDEAVGTDGLDGLDELDGLDGCNRELAAVER